MKQTTRGTHIKQRDIVLAPVSYSDLSEVKSRPVVVLSTNEYNASNEDIICCTITKNQREYYKSINLTNNDLEQGHLDYDSKIRPTKIFTLAQNNIKRQLARLNIAKSKEVVKQVNLCIDIQ